MSISIPTSTSLPLPSTQQTGRGQWSAAMKQERQDFKALRDALKSGDTAAAQQAYDTLKKDLQSNGNSSPLAKQLLDPNSSLGKDFAAIGQALQSKDSNAAQNAFASLQKDFQSLRGNHGPGGAQKAHRHPDNDGDADDVGSASNGTSGTTSIQISIKFQSSGSFDAQA